MLTLDETLPALLPLLDALPEDSPFLKLDPPQRRQRTLCGDPLLSLRRQTLDRHQPKLAIALADLRRRLIFR